MKGNIESKWIINRFWSENWFCLLPIDRLFWLIWKVSMKIHLVQTLWGFLLITMSWFTYFVLFKDFLRGIWAWWGLVMLTDANLNLIGCRLLWRLLIGQRLNSNNMEAPTTWWFCWPPFCRFTSFSFSDRPRRKSPVGCYSNSKNRCLSTRGRCCPGGPWSDLLDENFCSVVCPQKRWRSIKCRGCLIPSWRHGRPFRTRSGSAHTSVSFPLLALCGLQLVYLMESASSDRDRDGPLPPDSCWPHVTCTYCGSSCSVSRW